MEPGHEQQASHEPASVGVRELRQNLSVYLRRVQQGERLTVTEHGRVVAELIPKVASTNILEQLVATGLAVPPKDPLAPWRPSRLEPGQARHVGEELMRMRDEDDR